ncbi:MAG TPA: class I SAM-dependent methyltransferase [Candidatus Acidoferrales bacterium]
MKLTEAMRRDWDERARKNAFHYIASWRREWDVDSFLTSGEEDFARLVAPALERSQIPASGKVMVELGCGAGRMTRSFARRFGRVYAFDVSREMLQRARQIHPGQSNVLWLLGNGADLSCVQAGAADFIFSYLVLQHLPSKTLVFQYVREMLRILKPGGAFLFQFNGELAPTMNWRGRLAWGIVDAFWATHLAGASRGLARLLRLDPAVVGKSWRGVAIESGVVSECVRSAGGEVRELTGKDTPMAWCCGVKAAKQSTRQNA